MSNRKLHSTFALAILLCLSPALSLLQGCGSGGNSGAASAVSRQAQVRLNIVWPEKTGNPGTGRYIPSYASSLFLELYLTKDPTKRYTLIANRPSDKPSTQSVVFSQLLNEGDYTLAGAARVSADGQGATVASAVTAVAVKAGMAPVELSLATTIKTISILGQPLTASIGTNATLQGGAYDPDGRSLLLPAGSLTWSVVSGGSFGTLTPAGVLTPTAAGVMRVRLSEPGAGVTGEANVTISTVSVSIALGSTPYPKEGVDLANTSYVTGKGAKGNIAWTYDAVSSTYVLSSPILGGNGLVYIATDKSDRNTYATAVKTSDGTKAWSVALNLSTVYSPIALSNNTICFPGNTTGVVALDALTGIERWRNDSGNATSGLGVDKSNHLVFGTRDGLIINDAGTGSSVASVDGRNASLPAIGADGTLYFVWQNGSDTRDGRLSAVNPVTRQILWTAVDIESGSTPVIGPNGWVYVIGSQGPTVAFTRLVAFDPASGAIKAELRNQSHGFSANLAFDKNSNLYVSLGNKVISYNLTFGINWSSVAFLSDTNEYLPARAVTVGPDSTIYVTADQNGPSGKAKVYALSTVDGSKKWEVSFTGRVLKGMAVDTDGTIYALTDLGKLIAIK